MKTYKNRNQYPKMWYGVVWCGNIYSLESLAFLVSPPLRDSSASAGSDFQHPRPDFRTYTRPRTPNTCPGHQIHVQNINLYPKILPKSTRIPKSHKNHRFSKFRRIVPAKFRCDSNGNNQISPKPLKIKN